MAGNSNYNPVTSTTVTVTLQKADQGMLTINTVPPLTYNTTVSLFVNGGSTSSTPTLLSRRGDPCSIMSPNGLKANSGTGTCTVTATRQGDSNYNPVTSTPKTVTLQKANQAALTFNPSSPLTYHESEALTATGGSTASTPNFSLRSGDPCTLTDNQLKATSGTGFCQVTATMAGNDNYNNVAAVRTVTLQKASQAALTLSANSTLTYNQSELLGANGGSTTSTPTFALTSGDPCTLTINQLKANSGTGSCRLTATMAGDNNYNIVTSAQVTVNLQKAAATVTLGNMTVTYNGSPQSPTASTSAGALNVTLTGAPQTNAGDYSVTASISDNNYTGSATGTFKINKANQTITFLQPASPAAYGSTFIVNPASSSLLTVGVAPSVSCSISGAMVAITASTGTCTLTASQPGDNNFNAAAPVTKYVTATKVLTTTVVAISPNTPQYSDVVTLTATVSPASVAGTAAAQTVSFFIGTQSMGSVTVVGGAATLTVALTESSAGQLAPGSRTASAVFGGVNANFAVGSPTALFTLAKENARVDYAGTIFAWTSSANSGNFTATLSATIRDITAVTGDPASDAYPGDITKATVKFVNRDASNAVLCSATGVGLVDSSDKKTGTATCNWSGNITGNSSAFTVGIVVDGYYTRDAAEDDAVVTISKPLTSFITGGGYLVNQASAGQKPGEPGKKTNFGFSVKYTKNATSLVGNLNTIVRSGGRTYQIKANAMTSLSVRQGTQTGCTASSATSPCLASFNSKASIQDITDAANPISIDGNASLQVDITDYGTASGNTIAITLWDKNGGLWFASKWDGVKTVEQTMGGGNLSIK